MFDVNSYFDGKVKSIAFEGKSLPATVGVMAKGEYEFSTRKKEVMTVVEGEMQVRLPGAEVFRLVGATESFTVGAGETFAVKAEKDVAYLCTYEGTD